MYKYVPMENATVSKLWGIASTYNSDDDEALALAAFRVEVQQYRDDVKALGYDGSNCSMMGEPDGPNYQWNFPGSLLFSITVITTIGIAAYILYSLHGADSASFTTSVRVPLSLDIYVDEKNARLSKAICHHWWQTYSSLLLKAFNRICQVVPMCTPIYR